MITYRKDDVYGYGIYQTYLGKEETEIIERDDGLFDISPISFKGYLSEYYDWPWHEREAIKQVNGRILDIGCGAGRHSLYLTHAGYDVTAIDRSPLAVKTSKLRGLKKVYLRDIMDIDESLGLFDTVLLFGLGFGLLESRKKAKQVLTTLSKITTKNAQLIAESIDIDKTSDRMHKKYHKRNQAKGRMPGQLRIRIRCREFVSSWRDYLLATKEEMVEMLASNDWKIKKFYDSKIDDRYIAIAQKN